MESFKRILEGIRRSEARLPARISIPRSHVDEGDKLGGPFQRDEHYFQVEVNEMYLSYSREWFSKYDPMVLVISEFTYDKSVQTVPFVVGPMLMKKYAEKLPARMVFSDTRVAGLHPYRGGGLTLSVVLYRVPVEDYARKLMRVIEKSASVLDFATGLSTYVKVGGIILDGVEALLDLGDTHPLVGLRQQFGAAFEPGYFALIDLPESEIDRDTLWVRNRQLVQGPNLKNAEEFREADYVLYSITQTSERGDLDTLPIYPLWERVVREATVPSGGDYWKNATANMSIFYQSMVLSPDLIGPHAEKLADEYIEKMQILHKRATKIGNLGRGEKPAPSELDAVRSKAVSILEM
jgi:hypothetical protein